MPSFCYVLSLESQASDHKYRYLSAFETWVSNTIFYPIQNTMNVKVLVELECVEGSLVGGSGCEKCQKKGSRHRLDGFSSRGEINLINVENIVSPLLRAVPHFLLDIAMYASLETSSMGLF